MSRQHRVPALPATLGMTVVLAGLTGCSALNLGGGPFSRPDSPTFNGREIDLSQHASLTEESYRRVRQAKSENAIVLQIDGDKSPVRILPLPPDGTAVYVSQLLKQTGLLKKLGSVDAVLYRDSVAMIGGVPMDIRMTPDGEAVRPETDYVLQPGDRISVRKAASPAMQGLLNAFLGV